MATKAQQVDFLLSPVREPGSGLIVDDGRVYFFSPGTTTPVTVYQNRNKTVTAANPFSLGADGTGLVYIDGTVDIVIKRANGYGDDRQDMWTQIKSLPGITCKAVPDPIEVVFEDGGWTTLNEAIAAIGATETDLKINSTVGMTADVTLPTTCRIIPTRKGYINQGIHTITINSTFERGRVRVFMGTGPVVFGAGAVERVYPEWFSATGGVKEAWAAAAESSRVSLARKEYVEPVGITNTTRGAGIEGFVGERNNASIKGSVIKYTGNGAWFTNGSDSGNDWDTAEYNGPQTLIFSDFSLKYGGAVVALSNGAGYYGANTYGIRDWRGGTIKIRGMQFENWDYPFWGVQSDINDMDATILYCEHGVYAGPRSDQFRIDKLYALYCTQALILDGCVAWVNHLIIKECGHQDKLPVEIRQVGTANNKQCTFNDVWVEDYDGGTASYVNAFFDVGRTAGNNGTNTSPVEVIIDKITYLDHGSTSVNTKHIAKVGKGYCEIRRPKGDFYAIVSLIDFVGGYSNTSAGGYVEGRSFLGAKAYSNTGGGTPDMDYEGRGQGGGFTAASSNKHHFQKFTTTGDVDAGKSFAIYSAVDNQIAIEFTERSDAADGSDDIFRISTRHYIGHRTYVDGSAADNPTAGTWEIGDSFTYSYGGTAIAHEGKKCTTKGTQGTLTGVTGSITSGTNLLTINAANPGVYKGAYITIAGVTGVKKMTAINGLVVTLDSNADATVADAAVAYSPAKYKVYGAVTGAEV